MNGSTGKSIVVIETPPTTLPYKQYTTLMSDEELAEAKQERPDLIFRKAEELPSEGEYQPVQEVKEAKEGQGISIRGMTMPTDIDIVLEDE